MSDPQVPLIDLKKIVQIESSGNPLAHNSGSGAAGLAQITPIALQDWNKMNPSEQYLYNHLFNPQVNIKIANWYFNNRIPQMLKHYNMPVTLDNVLAAYNSGIGNVIKKRLPKETVDYIKKYRSMK